MYSCANYPRGCRGRVNRQGAKCSDCVSLNLRRPASPFAQPREYKRALPSELFGELSKLSEPKLQ
ncbi:uncharacterized protein N7518_005536 [Penicillium psychrosexuale]|uniref:Genomic scaffold, ProqFM164S04 n=1 Tax=Penicillium roqueforti (strain FM164) TaxID=1365484 RepID=W6QHP6_PENRF|nr:uncharacterized protein N7518_005536 [Penicillium psychrosexuale]KAJ5796996.1 hypothetical protein N7518_005536 [Penicillium psychrosexuale]CDM35950.1 unnamed protein product [Penicillium roqueforti FM164]